MVVADVNDKTMKAVCEASKNIYNKGRWYEKNIILMSHALI
jgi:hypothetical protein